MSAGSSSAPFFANDAWRNASSPSFALDARPLSPGREPAAYAEQRAEYDAANRQSAAITL